jgi:hypothetical protein
MQWRCLVMLDRHDGNRKAAAHAVGVSEWTFTYHLRALCRSQGFPSVHRALMYYCDDLTRINRKPRRVRCRTAPEGQADLGFVA